MTTTMTTTATTNTAIRARASQPALAGAARLLAGAWLLAATCSEAQAQIPAAAAPALKPVVVAQGLANPWGLAFLPDGRMLVTERAGRLRIVAKDGSLSAPLAGLPAIAVGGQCGLLDVVTDPQFASNQRIFFTFAEPAPAGASGNSTAVGRARLVDDKLVDVQTIFVQQPKVASQAHCGSRIVFLRDGTLVVGLGDRFSRKDDAQNAANHLGKTVRITAEGQAAPGNPLASTSGNAPEVWSIGHRNIQGMAVHPASGEVWAVEHGPQGGDELNVVEGGKNYGWPLVTYGRNYGAGTRIGEDGPKPGYEHPLKWWVPTSVAPAGLAFVASDRYPGWKGSLVMGTLRGQTLHRLQLDGRKVVAEDVLDSGIKDRIRDVRQGADGWLYVLTDSSDGRLLRMELR
jgi:glucose/arabinose dehydrogenase